MLSILKDWALARWAERTTWNGTWLIVIGGAIVLGLPFIKYLAYAAIAYGAWQIFKKEA